MGSVNSKEKELNEDLERIRKERVKARQREEKERDEKERDEKERDEKDRVANSKLIRIKIFSPAPGYEIEIRELETVLALLEKFVLLVGLNRSAAKSLQLEFSETTLAHELQLEPAGLCDESLCSVLGHDGMIDLVLKANAVDIVAAARLNKVAEVRLVCQYAAEKVHDESPFGWTALHYAANYNRLEVAELLLGAGASVDAKDTYGDTALDRAKGSNHQQMVALLSRQ